MLTSKDILKRYRTQSAGIVVRLYAPDAIPTIRVLNDGSFAPAIYRTHMHVGTRYMRAA